MTDILYSLNAIICAIMIEIILNRTLKLKSSDRSDRVFAAFLVTAFSFCILDAFWGLCSAGAMNAGDTLFMVFAYAVFLAGTAVAYAWVMYVETYIDGNTLIPKCMGAVLGLAEVVLFAVNFRTNFIFGVKDGVFFAGCGRWCILAMWAVFYVYSGLRMLVRYLGLRGDYARKRTASLGCCSIAPLILILFKGIYLRAPFYSIGIMMMAVIIFIFNISSEYEHLITLENRITRIASRQNREMVTAIADLFRLMTVINIKLNRCRSLKEADDGDDDEGEDEGLATVYLANLVMNTVGSDQIAAMETFTDIDTLPARLAGRKTISHEYTDRDGVWCRAYFIVINEDERHSPDEVIFAVEVVDDEKLEELEHTRSMEGENAIYREMLLAQSDGMLVTDMEDHIILMNDAAGRMFGVPDPRNADVGLKKLIGLCESDEKNKILDMLIALKAIGGRRSYEFTIVHDDSRISVMAATYVTTLKESNMQVVITSLTDISAKKSLEKALTVMSETDALTGISNRGGGEAKIMKLLEDGTPGMFALMDVDKFKSVNDNFGHGVGDKVLVEVAKCLTRSFRDADVVMRLGGDEFAVYATGITRREVAETCLKRLYREVAKIDVEEMRDSGHRITLSLGAVFCEKLEVQSFDELYHQADSVMYVSKRGGGDHYEIA